MALENIICESCGETFQKAIEGEITVLSKEDNPDSEKPLNSVFDGQDKNMERVKDIIECDECGQSYVIWFAKYP